MGSSKTVKEKKTGTLQFAVKSDDFPAQVQPELALVKPILPRLFLLPLPGASFTQFNSYFTAAFSNARSTHFTTACEV